MSDAESVAQYMYKGGPIPPQASMKSSDNEDRRPEKKYWNCVRDEMHVILCTDDKRYRELRKRIATMGKDPKLVYVIAAALTAMVGALASVIAGFIAVCLYAIVKVGTEAYCKYSSQSS